MTYQLVYVSAATTPFSPAALGSLLMRSRSNNQRMGVTGLLIHHAGSFFQVLEGGQSVVENLYQRIHLDSRHSNVVPLVRGEVTQAAFPNWSMGFADGDPALTGSLPGFNHFWSKGFTDGSPSEVASRARGLALAFRDGRLRHMVQV